MEGWYIYIFSGVIVTLKYAVFASILGISFGSVIAVARISDNFLLKNISRVYISIIRGTPLMVQLSIIYFGVAGLLKIDVPVMMAGLIAFSINSSAYVAEVVRGGILSIDKGQFEAAKVLGINKFGQFYKIILPQMLRLAIPNLSNVWQITLKDTSLISVTGLVEIMRQSYIAAGSTRDPLFFYSFAAVLYLLLTYVSMKLINKLEVKYSRGY